MKIKKKNEIYDCFMKKRLDYKCSFVDNIHMLNHMKDIVVVDMDDKLLEN